MDPQQQHRFRTDDEPAELSFGIVRGIDLVADLVDEQRLLRRQCVFNGYSGAWT